MYSKKLNSLLWSLLFCENPNELNVQLSTSKIYTAVSKSMPKYDTTLNCLINWKNRTFDGRKWQLKAFGKDVKGWHVEKVRLMERRCCLVKRKNIEALTILLDWKRKNASRENGTLTVPCINTEGVLFLIRNPSLPYPPVIDTKEDGFGTFHLTAFKLMEGLRKSQTWKAVLRGDRLFHIEWRHWIVKKLEVEEKSCGSYKSCAKVTRTPSFFEIQQKKLENNRTRCLHTIWTDARKVFAR